MEFNKFGILTLLQQALYQGIKSKQVEAGKRRKEKEMNLRTKVMMFNTVEWKFNPPGLKDLG